MHIDVHHHFHVEGELKKLILGQFQQLRELIMSNQSQFDTQVQQINDKLDTINTTIQNESQQIADFIAAHPSVNTSALQGVVDRLSSIDTSVAGIFTPPDSGS